MIYAFLAVGILFFVAMALISFGIYEFIYEDRQDRIAHARMNLHLKQLEQNNNPK